MIESEIHIDRPRRKPVINITSLIDVLFLLLIFFMVTSTFVKEAALKVDLPTSKGKTGPKQLKSVDVVISKDQTIQVNGANVKIEELQGKVIQAMKSIEDPDTVVHFMVDKGVPYGLAIEVMGELKDAGVKTVLAAIQIKEEAA